MRTASNNIDPSEKQSGIPEVITLAMERFKAAAEAEQEVRGNALDDLKFRIGDQWPSEVETTRTRDGRPCLTMNRIPAFLRQVTNEQRQQKPAGQVNPAGNGADIETAEILEGMVRHVETISDVDAADDHAFEMMCTIGFGYERVITEYCEGSLDQEPRIRRIKNPFSVYFDCAAVEPDYSDAKWAFIVDDLNEREYKSRYPKSELASLSDFSTIGDHAPNWVSRSKSGTQLIRIAEYFYVEDEEETLIETSSGVYPKDHVPEGEQETDRREATRQVVHWLKINALEVLEETVWPGKFIPIIPVLGDDLDIDGKRYLAGMVRNAKDPQRMYNYQISAATEASALQPKAPFIAAEGQTEGHEEQWEQANVRNFAVLYYKTTDVGGKPVPPPQRQSSDTQLASYSFLIRQADNDLKATTGIFDASLGEKGPDQSGRAILARQKQGDIANLNWTDNMARAIRFRTRLLIDLLPRLITKPKIQRIINPDQSVKHVAVTNSQNSDPSDLANPVGYDKVYDLGVGVYDVTVSVGPTYQSKRAEAVASQMALVNAYPPLMQAAGDLLVKNMDWPGAQQISERLYKMLPPQLQDQDTEDPKVQLVNVQQQAQQMAQKLQEATGVIQQLNQQINTEKAKYDYQFQIKMKEIERDIAVANINASKDLDKAKGDRLFSEMEMAAGHAHEFAMAQAAPPPASGNGANGSQPEAGGQQPAENA